MTGQSSTELGVLGGPNLLRVAWGAPAAVTHTDPAPGGTSSLVTAVVTPGLSVVRQELHPHVALLWTAQSFLFLSFRFHPSTELPWTLCVAEEATARRGKKTNKRANLKDAVSACGVPQGGTQPSAEERCGLKSDMVHWSLLW